MVTEKATVTPAEYRSTYRADGWQVVAELPNGDLAIRRTTRNIADQEEMYPSDRKRMYKRLTDDGNHEFASKGRLPDDWDQEAEDKIGGDPRR